MMSIRVKGGMFGDKRKGCRVKEMRRKHFFKRQSGVTKELDVNHRNS